MAGWAGGRRVPAAGFPFARRGPSYAGRCGGVERRRSWARERGTWPAPGRRGATLPRKRLTTARRRGGDPPPPCGVGRRPGAACPQLHLDQRAGHRTTADAAPETRFPTEAPSSSSTEPSAASLPNDTGIQLRAGEGAQRPTRPSAAMPGSTAYHRRNRARNSASPRSNRRLRSAISDAFHVGTYCSPGGVTAGRLQPRNSLS